MVIPLLCVRPHPVQPGDGVGVALYISIHEHDILDNPPMHCYIVKHCLHVWM